MNKKEWSYDKQKLHQSLQLYTVFADNTDSRRIRKHQQLKSIQGTIRAGIPAVTAGAGLKFGQRKHRFD